MNEKEKKMIEDMKKVLCDKNCEECSSKLLLPCGYKTYCTKLYNANYRKVADDEIVVAKRQYEQLKKHNNDRKRLRNKWQTSEHEAEYWKSRCKEIGDVASRETAREILKHIKDNIELVDFGCGGGVYEMVDMDTEELKELANKYGVDLED